MSEWTWLASGLLVAAVVTVTGCGGDSGGANPNAAACGEGDAAGAPVGVVPAAIAAALPPEPIEDVLSQASDVVDAEVTEVLYNGVQPTGDTLAPDEAGPLPDEPCQVVLLDVGEALFGSAEGEIEVVKPQMPYTLETGDGGVFLLDDTSPDPTILGLYGPDSYSRAEVEKALRKQQ